MPSPSNTEDYSFPPDNAVEIRLVLRGDNYIYYRGRKIAHVKYIPRKPPQWQATTLVGIYAGRHTPEQPSKVEVLHCIWYHRYLDSLF